MEFNLVMILTIFFLVYLVLSFTRNYKKGLKAVGLDMLQTPLRLLLALIAISTWLNDQKVISVVVLVILFANTYYYSKKDREEIRKIKQEIKEHREKHGKQK